jgi:hypothetical protein
MNQKIVFELIWWLITIVLCGLFIYPIYSGLGEQFKFYVENVAFIVLFVTGFRYIFFTKYHWFAQSNKTKLVFIFLSIPLLMYLVDSLWDFQTFLDNYGMYSMMDGLHAEKQRSLTKYIKTEMIFTWSGAIICFVIFPFKMLRSIWLLKNRNTLD